MSGTKRSFVEAGQGSKGGGRPPPPRTRRKRDPLDTLRFKPLQDAPMISPYLVACYTRQYGQDLFMKPNMEERYIDVRFVDADTAAYVKQMFLVPELPFEMALAKTIDASRVITPGRVTMYRSPRDLDHDNTQPSVPLGWNNPFGVEFEFPPADDRAHVVAADDAAGVVAPAADDEVAVVAPAADDEAGIVAPAADDEAEVVAPVADDEAEVVAPAADDEAGIVAPAADDEADDEAPAADDEAPAPDDQAEPPRRLPRVKAKDPPRAQPDAPSPKPPFDQPEWPTPPSS